MTALGRIREKQETLAESMERMSGGEEWQRKHREWLALQRDALAILRGERCEEHGFEKCHICQPDGPLRPER